MIAKLGFGRMLGDDAAALVIGDPTSGTVVAIVKPPQEPDGGGCACATAPLWRGLKQRWMQPAACCA